MVIQLARSSDFLESIQGLFFFIFQKHEVAVLHFFLQFWADLAPAVDKSSQTYLTEEQKTWPIETYLKEQIVEYVPPVTDPTTNNRLQLLVLFQYACVYCEVAKQQTGVAT